MVSIVNTYTVIGVNGVMVGVETDISPGVPGFDVVGLAGGAVREARERVRAALKNSGLPFPSRRVTVNLAPADMRKDGAGFDVPIALGILCAAGVIKQSALDNTFAIGELSLDAQLRAVPGVLPMAANAAGDGAKTVILPSKNAGEAAIVAGIAVIPADTLKAAVEHLQGVNPIKPFSIENGQQVEAEAEAKPLFDFADVRGQVAVKRAITVAAAGGHNLLMIGPPGSGKTMMAKCIPSILPKLSFSESVEVTKIHSVAGLTYENKGLITRRPYRSPHHTVSYAALTGGGRVPKPGEISLSHKGVLFLDELPEFPKSVLEMLRQPMEDRTITVSRVGGVVEYPTEFMLIASMNPCPCGFYPDRARCGCSKNDVERYLGKISGPLLDRIDIQTEAPRVAYEEIGEQKRDTGNENIITSAHMRGVVMAARDIQLKRLCGRLNADMTTGEVRRFCALDEKGERMLKIAFDKMGLSMRAYTKILKTARTIADIDGADIISPQHLAEAVGYRAIDRKYW